MNRILDYYLNMPLRRRIILGAQATFIILTVALLHHWTAPLLAPPAIPYYY